MNNSLDRFLVAQEHSYDTALREIRSGRKRSHWMWYIFPQIAGLGMSYTAQLYAIKDIEEARQYIAHPVLGARLIEISQALLTLDCSDAAAVMGYPDDLKLRSCMTLFAQVSDDPVFDAVLAKFYGGILMLSGLKNVDWDDILQVIPVALMLIFMPITGSIGHGIGMALISYSVVAAFTGKAKEVSILTYVLSALFLAKFFIIV